MTDARPARAYPASSTRHLWNLRAAQMNRCGICGDIFGSAPINLDHVVPRSRGGGNLFNVVAAHRTCNARKGNRKPTGCEMIWLAVANKGMTK